MMKRIVCLLLVVCLMQARAQNCPTTNLPPLDVAVCGGSYGDAAGNTTWNWELSKSDPNYCKMWYANTWNNTIIPIGSPFMTASTGAIDAVAKGRDYTKEKGWVLLRREFGCSRPVNYPYFVLYNTFRGIIRVFVYQPATSAPSSGLMIEVTPTPTPASYPALTALADPIAGSVDQFRYENGARTYGKSIIAVGEPAGPSNWTMVEFPVGFDPNVDIYDYTGAGLKFVIYNVLTFDMKATIKGRSVTGSDPQIYNYNYVPTSAPEPQGDAQKFIAMGVKFGKAASTIEQGRKDVYKAATDLHAKLSNEPKSSVKYKISQGARGIMDITNDTKKFAKTISTIASTVSVVGTVLNVVGNLFGLFDDEAPTISYSSINMELQGSLTAKTVGQSFIIRIPGTRTDPNGPADEQRSYYECPLGIAALKNIPRADVVTYQRIKSLDGIRPVIFNNNHKHRSYRLKNDLVLAVNEKAGLELVEAKVAFVSEILPVPPGEMFQGTPGYDPLGSHSGTFVNYMLPEFQSFRYTMLNYDSAGFHSFRSQFVDIGCANGFTFNVISTSNVYLRIIAVLKRKNDPAATPIFFSKDYAIKTDDVQLSENVKNLYLNSTQDKQMLTPYTNLTEHNVWQEEYRKIPAGYFNSGDYYVTDNEIYTEGAVISPTNAQNVMLNAGSEITLNPGFEAGWGTTFTAQINRYGFNLNCITPIVEKYNSTGSCFNTTVIPMSLPEDVELPVRPSEKKGVVVYPVPSNGVVTVEVHGLPASVVTITDVSGKPVLQQAVTNAITRLNLQHLPNGVYLLKIVYPDKTIVKKIQLNK